MHSESRIVVSPSRYAVPVPAVPDIAALDESGIGIKAFLGILPPDHLQRSVHDDAEEVPVALWHLMVVYLVQPCGKVILRLLGERLPEQLRYSNEAEGYGGHLHEPLVVVGRVPPVLSRGRIGARFQPLQIMFLEEGITPSPIPEWYQAPERAGE